MAETASEAKCEGDKPLATKEGKKSDKKQKKNKRDWEHKDAQKADANKECTSDADEKGTTLEANRAKVKEERQSNHKAKDSATTTSQKAPARNRDTGRSSAAFFTEIEKEIEQKKAALCRKHSCAESTIKDVGPPGCNSEGVAEVKKRSETDLKTCDQSNHVLGTREDVTAKNASRKHKKDKKGKTVREPKDTTVMKHDDVGDKCAEPDGKKDSPDMGRALGRMEL